MRPGRRRQGVATALVRDAECALVALGCVKVNLQVREDGDGARAFYESLGYVVELRLNMGKPLGKLTDAPLTSS